MPGIKRQRRTGSSEVVAMSFGDEPIDRPFAPESRQIKDEMESLYGAERGKAIKPSFTPLAWGNLLGKNTRLNSCIRAMALNTVGLGIKIAPVKMPDEFPDEGTDERQELENEIREQTVQLQKVIDRPNAEMPFPNTMILVVVDRESTGNGYLEVIDDINSRPREFVHAPASITRKRVGGGFVQIKRAKIVYFKEFGDPRILDPESGIYYEPDDPKAPSLAKRATSMLHFLVYDPSDAHYGVPRYQSCALAIAGSYSAAERNLAFFDNDATPRMVVIAEGGLSDKTIQQVQDFVRLKGKGAENAHRVLILQSVRPVPNAPPAKIEVIPLTVGSTDDASFTKYTDSNDEQVREAFRIAKIFLGTTDDVNRASAYISRKATIEQVFLPEIQLLEYVFNSKVLPAMGITEVKLEFKKPESGVGEEMEQFIKAGAYTPNDIRRMQGFAPYDEPWGDIPMALALVFAQQGLFLPEGMKELARLTMLDSLLARRDSRLASAARTGTGQE